MEGAVSLNRSPRSANLAVAELLEGVKWAVECLVKQQQEAVAGSESTI